MKVARCLVCLLAVAIFGSVLSAQTGPVITVAYAAETTVTGTAPAGSGPITILNIQFPAVAKLGTGALAKDGSFAIALQAPLQGGHGIVAVDASGKRSARFNVLSARPSPLPVAPPQ